MDFIVSSVVISSDEIFKQLFNKRMDSCGANSYPTVYRKYIIINYEAY